MVERLANAVAKYWIIVILAWVALAVGLKFVAPNWSDVAYDGDLEHLPADAPSAEGGELLRRAFESSQSSSQIAVVVSRADDLLGEADYAVADRLAETFRTYHERPEPDPAVIDVWTRDTEVVGRMLRSPDGRSVL